MEPVHTEMVYQISAEEQRQVLENHFNLFYAILGEMQLTPNAAFENTGEIQRSLSGIPVPYHNAVLGYPQKEDSWDACIDKQVDYFNKAKMPFVWYLNEEASPEFQKKLLDHGFQDAGTFRGVLGFLDKPISDPEIPEGCTLELVTDESAMDEFNELVCSTFALEGISKELFRKVLWDATQSEKHPMFHWLARKEGKAVSALSTLVDGNCVSFWNGATLPELRHQGLSTALRHLALQDATARGCRIGMSYLMSEGLALGICNKLGYQTKWRFNVFSSPVIDDSN